MSKQYLAGTLSPEKKYEIEDQLLKNDFYFEAMEGLEQLSWGKCQKQLEETESRIIKEFSIDQGANTTQKIALTVLGLFISSILGTWYFTTSTLKTVDLSPTPKETLSTAPDKITLEDTASKITSTKVVVDKEPKNDLNNTLGATATATATPATKKTTSTPPVQRRIDDAATHITVGRIVDTRGIAIPNALVTSGKVSDTTDRSGYYALKIAIGGTQLLVTHLTTEYLVEIDTNQNWEIVLDIAKQVVHDYHPMNAANRFK